MLFFRCLLFLLGKLKQFSSYYFTSQSRFHFGLLLLFAKYLIEILLSNQFLEFNYEELKNWFHGSKYSQLRYTLLGFTFTSKKNEQNIYFLFTSLQFQYSSISLTSSFKYLFVDNLDSQCVIIHRIKLAKKRKEAAVGGREMFMQIDFIWKSCGGRFRIARKEWKFCASPFSAVENLRFPFFYSFPEWIFSFFTLCKITFFFLFSTQTSAHGLGVWFVVRLKQDWKCG